MLSACSGSPSPTCGVAGGSTGIDPCASTGGTASTGGATTSSGTAGGGNTSGGTTSSGTATGGTTSGGGTAVTCPAPPSGVSTDVSNAYTLENNTRAAMGIPCATMVSTLNTCAMNHCQYYVQNVSTSATSPSTGAACASEATAHSEISDCNLFTGADPGAREKAAGYTGTNWSEDMAFLNNGTQAVQMWIDSVWHRTPILSPWVRDFGYGNASAGSGSSAAKCDTMDFNTGTTTAATVVATYPYAGQTGLPVSFNGANEGPTPPAPPNGWPSGYPIHIYAKKATITTHELRVGSCTGTTLDHQWITPGSAGDPDKLLTNEQVMYGNAPLTSQTTYCVIIQGTRQLRLPKT